MLAVEQIEQYKRSGFVNAGPVLDDQTVGILQEEVLRVIEDRDNPAKPQPVRLANLSGDEAHPML